MAVFDLAALEAYRALHAENEVLRKKAALADELTTELMGIWRAAGANPTEVRWFDLARQILALSPEPPAPQTDGSHVKLYQPCECGGGISLFGCEVCDGLGFVPAPYTAEQVEHWRAQAARGERLALSLRAARPTEHKYWTPGGVCAQANAIIAAVAMQPEPTPPQTENPYA